jgi:probable HAF family extracellular repeat protein
MHDLGTLAYPSSSDSYGEAINASGQVVGYDGSSGIRAFIYTGTPGVNSGMKSFGNWGSKALGINATADVVGVTRTQLGTDHAFLYSSVPGQDSSMADLGTLGGSRSQGSGINDNKEVVGYSLITGDTAAHAFLYTGTPGVDGTMVDLGTLGGPSSFANAINAGGQIAGSSGTNAGTTDAFLYTGTPGVDGHMADLGALGGSGSSGRAINSTGQVVGVSNVSGGGSHAFLYTGTPGLDGHMIDLDAWLDASDPIEGAKWTLTEAAGISDTGLITGTGYYDDGPGGLSDGDRAFLLDASGLVPEPGSLALLGLSSVMLLRRRARC